MQKMQQVCRLIGLLAVLICPAYSVDTEKQPLQPTRVFRDGENTAFVFDNVLGNNLLRGTGNLVRSHGTWKFVYPDPQEGVEKTDNGDLHWYAPFAPEYFAKSLIWAALKKGLKGTGMLDGKQFLPYQADGIMLLRGFSPVLYKGKNKGDIYMRVFLNMKMKKNDYSELNLYNQKEEIFASIHPRYGRVVLWNDTSDFIFKPPSMNYEQGEYSLLIKATTDKQKFKDRQKKYLEETVANKKLAGQPFPFSNSTSDDFLSKINASEHLSYKFTDSANRVVAVFDNVVPKEELDAVRSYFYNLNSAYYYDKYDPALIEQHDNVNWIVKVNPENITTSRIWKYIKHLTKHLSGEDNWYPYDVAMNIIQHTHHTRIHSDCAENEHEYTFLMYLSTNWQSERYGETIFVETSSENKKMKMGQESYNTLSAVIPKYGRIVLFRNIIDHSARPPSPDFLGARYTFAVKVGRSPEIALAKALREKLERFSENPDALKLQEEIYQGKYDISGDAKTEEFLKKKLQFYQSELENSRIAEKANSFKLLKLKQVL